MHVFVVLKSRPMAVTYDKFVDGAKTATSGVARNVNWRGLPSLPSSSPLPSLPF